MWWTACHSAVWFFCCVLHEASLMLTYALWHFQGRDCPYAWLIFHSISTPHHQPFLHQLGRWCCFKKKKKVLSVSPLLKKIKRHQKMTRTVAFICLFAYEKTEKDFLGKNKLGKDESFSGTSLWCWNRVRGTCACLTWWQPVQLHRKCLPLTLPFLTTNEKLLLWDSPTSWIVTRVSVLILSGRN